MQIVQFRISNVWVGVDVLSVEGITRCPDAYSVFSPGREVCGLLPFHGRQVPLVELASWLNIPGYFPGEARHVVVLDLVRVMVGLIVGEVRGIVEVSKDPSLPLQGPGHATLDLLRAANVDGEIVHILEPEVFFHHDHMRNFMEAKVPKDLNMMD